MIALIRAELTRFWSRRAVRLVGLIAGVGIVLMSVLVFLNTEAEHDQARATAEYEASIEECVAFHDSPEGQTHDPVPPGFEDSETYCRSQIQVAEFDDTFRMVYIKDALLNISLFLIIFGLGLGATFIGAEWQAGTITTLLTWESRRTRVLVSKVLACALFVFLAALAVQAALALALVPTALFRGTTEGADAAWLLDTIETAARGAIVCAFAATIGFALASVARNTSAAVITGFLYFAVIEGLLRGFRPNWQAWLVGDNAVLFVVGQRDFPDLNHSAIAAGLILLGYATLAVGTAVYVFRARDVT